MTSQPVRVFPAMASHGNPAARALDQRPHVRAGLRAGAGDPVQHGRACRPGPGPAAPSGRSARRPAPGPGAPAPRYRSCSWRPARSPPPSTPARSPGPAAGDLPAFRSAALRPAVSPAWSAALRSSTAPACPTRPVPSPVTFRAWSHRVSCMAKSAPVSGKLQGVVTRNLPEPGRSSPLNPPSRARRAPGPPAPIRCATTPPAARRETAKSQLTTTP